MIKILFTCVVFCSLFSGCVGQKLKYEFENTLQQWVGKPVSELLAKNLIDKKKQTTVFEKNDGSQIVTINSQKIYDDVNPNGRRYSLDCTSIFETDPSGRIVSARYEGAGCW